MTELETTDTLFELLEKLKSLQSEPVSKPVKRTHDEIVKWKNWINSQELRPLRSDRRSIKELRQALPQDFDWHIATGFNQRCTTEHIGTGEPQPETSNQQNSGEVEVRENDGPISTVVDNQRSSHDDTMSSTMTLRDVDATNDQLSATLTKLLEEQRKIQSQLQEDMRSQENQFKQQMAKIAEQQRRLIERDALKDIIQQQQQILNQQMLNASAGAPLIPNAPFMVPNIVNHVQNTPLPHPTPPTSAMNAMSFNGTNSMSNSFQLVPPTLFNPLPGANVLSNPNGVSPSLGFTTASTAVATGSHHSPFLNYVPTNSGAARMAVPSESLSSTRPGVMESLLPNSQFAAVPRPSRATSEPSEGVSAAERNSAILPPASSSASKGKTTILQHLQSMQLSDSSDEEGLSLLSHNNTSLHHNTSARVTSGLDKTNTMKQDWALILSNPEHAWRWKIVVAVMKGWMVRRLMRTEKVQGLVTTIRDARDFLADLRYAEEEFPGMTDARDAQLQQRIISQLRAAIFELHHVFFDIPLRAKLDLIAHSRRHFLNKRLQTNSSQSSTRESHANVSAATLKARERRLHPSGSVDSDRPPSSREKKVPKRVDCGFRDGVLPKKEPHPPVKLDPRKFYSKHGKHRPKSVERT